MGAFRVGITGLPNTGKSFAWRTYQNGDEVFTICPSSKVVHIRNKDGNLPQPIQISVEGSGSSLEEIMKNKNLPNPGAVLSSLGFATSLDASKVKATGDYIICSDVKYVSGIKKFVDRFMPSKKIILTTDFTHFISYVIQDPIFIARKSGGEAFQRFWELAADTLRNTILSADSLNNVKLDITEFHSQYNQGLDQFEIYTPAGNMLVDKFKPESYFDIMMYSYVLPYETEKDETKRFKFITVKKEGYDGRAMGLFLDVAKEGMIPNDMNLVIGKLKEYLNIK